MSAEFSHEEIQEMVDEWRIEQDYFKCLGYRDAEGRRIPTLHSERCIAGNK